MCCDSGGSAPAPQDNKFTDVLADIAQKQWARNETAFQPLEDQLIQSAQQFQTPQYAAEQEGKASADVAQGFAKARAAQDSDMASMGVNPADGRFAYANRGLTLGQAGADAAAVTGARERAQTMAFDTLAGVAGKGDAKVGQAIGAAQAGGNQYAQLQRNQIDYQGQQGQGMAGLGSMVGMGLAMFSSKELKTDRRPFSDGLTAVRKMPVQSYRYKPGVPGTDPTKTRIGPMAEDYAKATGAGDGITIDLPSALGVTMAAVKQLDRKVNKLQGAQK